MTSVEPASFDRFLAGGQRGKGREGSEEAGIAASYECQGRLGETVRAGERGRVGERTLS